jgi:hypothetical protein
MYTILVDFGSHRFTVTTEDYAGAIVVAVALEVGNVPVEVWKGELLERPSKLAANSVKFRPA